MQEFIRVGYYVNNEYMEEELRENPPEKVLIDRSGTACLFDILKILHLSPPTQLHAMYSSGLAATVSVVILIHSLQCNVRVLGDWDSYRLGRADQSDQTCSRHFGMEIYLSICLDHSL